MDVLRPLFLGLLIIPFFLFFLGCSGERKMKVLDELQGSWSGDGDDSPIVEAYIEYTGSEARWAGPEKFVVHVLARDEVDRPAVVSISPPRFFEQIGSKKTRPGLGRKREVASDQNKESKSKPKPMSVQKVRNRLADLSTALTADLEDKTLDRKLSFKKTEDKEEDPDGVRTEWVVSERGGLVAGCLYPLRVWMIRANGAIFEKQGCRSASSWSSQVSDAANYFIQAAVNAL